MENNYLMNRVNNMSDEEAESIIEGLDINANPDDLISPIVQRLIEKKILKKQPKISVYYKGYKIYTEYYIEENNKIFPLDYYI